MSVLTVGGSSPTAPLPDLSDYTPAVNGRGASRPPSPPPGRSWKQRPCAYFQRTGTCRYGAGCRFEHTLPTPGGERLWSHAQADSNGVGHVTAGMSTPFTFMTYNVLADSLAQKHWAQLYRGVPWGALAWGGPVGRCARLLAEIARHAPDVIALQEVDRFQDIWTALSAAGYEGEHLSRTRGRSDGCATFWKRAAFELVDSQRLRFEDHGLRDNVALLTLLQPRRQQEAHAAQPWQQGVCADNGAAAAGGAAGNGAPAGQRNDTSGAAPAAAAAAGSSAAGGGPPLLFGNTHILFNPKRGDIKLAQVRVLLEAAAAMADAPTLVAGDFNSAPASGVHRFCSSGELELPAEDRSRLSGQHGGGGGGSGGGLGGLFSRSKLWSLGELECAMGRSPAAGDAARGVARHPLALRSAYAAVDGAEPVFSTSHGAAFTTVDYIWYTPQAGGWELRPTAVLLPPHPSTAAGGLPSMELPSDHIPLLARFELAAAHPAAAAAHPTAEAGPGGSARTDAPGNGAGERAGTRTAVHEAAAAAAEARAAAGGAAAARAGTLERAAPAGAAGNGSRQLSSDSSTSGGAGAEPQHQHAPKFVGIGTVL